MYISCVFLSVLPPDVSLTPHTLLHAVSTVRQFWFWGGGLRMYLGVPYSVMVQIRDSQSYCSEEERRLAGLQYYLQTVPGVTGKRCGISWIEGWFGISWSGGSVVGLEDWRIVWNQLDIGVVWNQLGWGVALNQLDWGMVS